MERVLRATRTGLTALVLAPFVLASGALSAQENSALVTEAYLTPPDRIAQAVLAPRHENVTLSNLSPDRRLFLNSESDGLPALAALAKPYYRLGGLEIDSRANRVRNFTVRGNAALEVIAWEDGRTVALDIPRGASAGSARWSPDGSQVAFFAHYDDATHIYVADVRRGSSRRLTRSPVLATMTTSFEWSADGRHIFTVVLPEGRGPEPARPTVPREPMVRLTLEGETPHRTYPSLLETKHDQALLEYYTTGRLVRIEVGNRRIQPIGRPAMIQNIDVAPDGRHIRVRTMQKPFSYIVPVSRFGNVDEIWDLDGNVLAEISRTPLRDGAERDDDDESGEPDRRNIAWRPDGQGLSFLQQEPEPEDENRRERRDRVFQWLPPFGENDAREIFSTTTRMQGVQYSDDARTLFVTERQSGREHVYAVHLDQPDERHTIYRWRTEDFVDNPGDLMTTRGTRGISVVRTSGDGLAVFLSGTRHHEDPRADAPQPFIDRVDIRSGDKTRIFESSPDVFEQVRAVLDDEVRRIVTTRETPTSVPNAYFRDLGNGALRRLTDNTDHTPDITHAERHLMDVTRVDGFRFQVAVTLPPGWDPNDPPPAMFWFYPREFTDQESYDRRNRNYNKNRFRSIGPRSMAILIRAGYAVVEPDAPIVGPQGRMNDNYLVDLRNNLSAVIDALAARGFIDRQRLALGGHSYGAFGTANAMAHMPYFRAGIAGNGNYNRLLTPSGFQTERRSLWESREVYSQMSTILWANQINGALLLYVGEDDQNTGTFPINSYRLFHALNTLGKTAAMYIYPYEGHGPAAEETLLDMWTRWVAFLDEHVKNAGPRAVETVAEQAAAGR